MTVIVIDSSAFSKFLLKEEGWENVIPYLEPDLEPHAVDMLALETANVIWKYARKYGLITEEQAFGLYEGMMKLVREEVIILESSGKYLGEALEIAMRYDIPIYDSLFIAQAKSLRAKLATSDKRQAEVAKVLGLEAVYIG
ncbi:type II toxin-antitoxin system VapC family toxin [Thermococcus kodakarensis]|uniref:type II toxin-antitoxin system VapC family toxin n=1 Tax=Thermococcus kodakarensis TaxID=311400 RepID=UPI00373AE686